MKVRIPVISITLTQYQAVHNAGIERNRNRMIAPHTSGAYPHAVTDTRQIYKSVRASTWLPSSVAFTNAKP